MGGLLHLLTFDIHGSRLFSIAIPVISFLFLIGPSFHTVCSPIVGFLQPPT